MKKYKLLKELPWLEVGTIIKYNNGRCSLYKEEQENLTNLGLQSLSTIESILIYQKETDWLEEIKEKPKSIYELEKGEDYYYIGDIWYTSKCNTIYWGLYKMYRLEFWNVFLTEKEAKKELEKREALAKIKKWIWENKIEINHIDNGKVSFEILYSKWEFYVSEVWSCWVNSILFHFKEDAERCLEECKQDWNILFDLKN